MKKITQLPNKVQKYLSEDYETLDLNKYFDFDNPEDRSLDIELPLENRKNIPGILYLSDKYGLLDKRELSSEDGKFIINNLYSGEIYKYKIEYSDGSVIEDEFKVEPGFLRMLNVGGLRNVRDFGGSYGRFGRLKQGLIIRGSEMNLIKYDTLSYEDKGKIVTIDKSMKIEDKCLKSALDHGIEITEEGKNTMINELKIKTDIDLRFEQETGNITSSPIGENVNYHRLSILGYMNMFREEFIPTIRSIMLLLTERKNYPVYIHCWAGADRTGTLLSVLKMYLGVSEEEIVRDHEISTMSIFGVRGRCNKDFTYPEVFEYIKSFKGKDLHECAEKYFTQVIGLRKTDLSKIESILTDGLNSKELREEDEKRKEYIKDINKFKASWESKWTPPKWANNFEEKMKSFPDKNGRAMAFGHRGDIEHYPENSIEGIISAVKIGADGVEIDCCYTLDGAIVLNHGSKLSLTTDFELKKGKVVNGIQLPEVDKIEEWTLLQLRQLNLRFGGGKYSDNTSEISKYKIATLEEAMVVCKDRCFMSLDRLREGGLNSPDWDYIYKLVKKTKAFRSLLYLNTALNKEDASDLRNVVKNDFGIDTVTIFDRTGEHNCAIEWFKEFDFTKNEEYDEYFKHCVNDVGSYILSNRVTHLIDWIDLNYMNKN